MNQLSIKPFVWVNTLPLYGMLGRIAIPIDELAPEMLDHIVSIRNDGN